MTAVCIAVAILLLGSRNPSLHIWAVIPIGISVGLIVTNSKNNDDE
jgi:hypothetical protein